MKNRGSLGRKIQSEGGVKTKLNDICFLTVYFVVKAINLFSAKFIEAFTSFLYRKPESDHNSFLIHFLLFE